MIDLALTTPSPAYSIYTRGEKTHQTTSLTHFAHFLAFKVGSGLLRGEKVKSEKGKEETGNLVSFTWKNGAGAFSGVSMEMYTGGAAFYLQWKNGWGDYVLQSESATGHSHILFYWQSGIWGESLLSTYIYQAPPPNQPMMRLWPMLLKGRGGWADRYIVASSRAYINQKEPKLQSTFDSW